MSIKTPTRDDVVHLLGDISDHKVVEILETGATLEQLEEAAAWLAGESDVMGEERLPLTGAAAKVYDIIARDELPERDRNMRR
jgi:hypothetical protein